MNKSQPIHQVVRKIMNRRKISTSNRSKRVNKDIEIKLSKKRNKSMYHKKKVKSIDTKSKVSTVEGLNILTDNFFTKKNKDESSEMMSPLIGSITGSVVEGLITTNFKNSKVIKADPSPMVRKSEVKHVNFSSKNLSPEGSSAQYYTEEDYDRIRQNRLRLLRTAKACIFKKVNILVLKNYRKGRNRIRREKKKSRDLKSKLSSTTKNIDYGMNYLKSLARKEKEKEM